MVATMQKKRNSILRQEIHLLKKAYSKPETETDVGKFTVAVGPEHF